MVQIVTVFLGIVAVVLAAEIPIDRNGLILNDMRTNPVESHALFKKEAPELRPIYKVEEGRASSQSEGGTPVKTENAASTEVNRIDNVQVPNYGFVPAPGHHEVAYPDVPYAPGYSYDNTYSPSNSYDVYANGLANYYPEPEPEPTTFSLLWSQIPNAKSVVNFVGRTIVWFINSAVVLAIGSILTVAFCSYTNLCTFIFHGVGPIHEEMRSLMSDEKLEKISHAADFVKNAIDKYQTIQKVSQIANSKRRR